MVKKILLVAVPVVVLATLAFFWWYPAEFREGDKVVIKECVAYSDPVPLDKAQVLRDGVMVVGSPDLMMRSGHLIGRINGIVRGCQVIDRGILKPVYIFTVEFSYEENGKTVTKQEDYYRRELERL